MITMMMTMMMTLIMTMMMTLMMMMMMMMMMMTLMTMMMIMMMMMMMLMTMIYQRMLVFHVQFCYIEARKVGELHLCGTQLTDKGTKIVMSPVHGFAVPSNVIEQVLICHNFWISLPDKLFKINHDITLQGDTIRDARGRWQGARRQRAFLRLLNTIHGMREAGCRATRL